MLNRLSEVDVLVEDSLFATLDPSPKRIKLPYGKECFLMNAIGFIQKLRKYIVAAFRKTLEERCGSSLLVPVVDISHPLAKQYT